jgi:hypothetical protein
MELPPRSASVAAWRGLLERTPGQARAVRHLASAGKQAGSLLQRSRFRHSTNLSPSRRGTPIAVLPNDTHPTNEGPACQATENRVTFTQVG